MKNFILPLVAGLLVCCAAKAQTIAVSTNILDYAQMGTLNVEASCGLARHWSLNGSVRYNPFTFERDDSDLSLKQRSCSAGARYWPWHIFSGWWLAGKLQYQEYNSTGFGKTSSSEGDRYGSGLSAGYTYMLGRHFNLDFGLGLWAGYDRYTTYECPRCGRITAKGSKYFVLPNDFLLSIAYIF